MEKEKKKRKSVWDDGYYKTYDTSKGFGSPKKWQAAFEQRMNFKVLTIEEKEENKGYTQLLEEATNKKDLQKIYHKLMMIHHPDRNNSSAESKTIAQHINNVYLDLKEKFSN
jgi:hypothetical protein